MEQKITTNMTAAELLKLPLHPLKTKFWQKPTKVGNAELPSLDTADDASLEMSIAQNGVQVPVIVCKGVLIDGFRRIKAASKFDENMLIPVFECDEDKSEITILNSFMQLKSLSKFQRLFVIYPTIKEAAEKLRVISQNNRIGIINHETELSSVSSKRVDGSVAELSSATGKRVDDYVTIFGVSFCRIMDLALFLNVSDRWIRYCKGVYEVIDKKIASGVDENLVRFMAHKFVFEDEIPVRGIAAAIGGFDSKRDPEKEDKAKLFSEVSVKVSRAFETVIERISRSEYLESENQHLVEQQLEVFASKLPESVALMLENKLSKRAQEIKKSKLAPENF